ncbi:MAG: glycosyltransferase, partial [Chloroflexales bacterium]|nr:glycosyltransferase [Chloroflexales bacterium]
MSKRLHIALIVPGFSTGEANWGIPVLLDLVGELARHHDVEVFALRYPHQRGSYQLAGATVHALGGGVASGPARMPLLVRALDLLRARQRTWPFDAVHGLWADEPGFLAVAFGRLHTCPALVTLMGGELVALPAIGYGGQLSRMNRVLAALALRGAHHVTVGSPVLAQIARHYVEPRRLAMLPLGIDTTLFHPQPGDSALLPPGRFDLLHVGSLVPVKDQAMLLRALARLATDHPQVHLHLVGSGPLEGELRALARQLGIAHALTFQGEIAHEQLPAYYRAAKLYVHASCYESQGMVLLEALACECAVVGTAVGVLP